MQRREWVKFAVGSFSWAIAVLVQSLNGGLLNSLLNPFTWWLSFLEVIEFAVWLAGPGSVGAYISNFGGSESTMILAGIVGIVGWVVLGVAFLRARSGAGTRLATIGAGLNLLFVPILSLGAVFYYLRNGSNESDPTQNQPSA
jgi:hypothetical protein